MYLNFFFYNCKKRGFKFLKNISLQKVYIVKLEISVLIRNERFYRQFLNVFNEKKKNFRVNKLLRQVLVEKYK